MTIVTVQCDTIQDVRWKSDTDRLPGDGALAVYRVSIAEFAPFIPVLTSLLQPDELLRAGRYHQPTDRHRFIVARSVLRILLGRYTGQPPAAVGFETGPTKKPALYGFPAVHYNIAHAGNWILIAVGESSVGIDVEKISEGVDYQAILGNYFGPDEQAYVAESPDGRQRFYQLWTRKEALTKATAKGIDDDFSCIPALTGEHRVAGNLLDTANDWHVGSFSVANDYAAALARTLVEPAKIPQFYHTDPGLLDTFSGPVVR